jgi:hypothetical protein
MEFNIWVEIYDAGRTIGCHKVATIERPSGDFRPEELGLSLAEGRAVCQKAQELVMTTQIARAAELIRRCIHCGRLQRIKDRRGRNISTVFGRHRVSCHRYLRCTCRGARPGVVAPFRELHIRRNTPEVIYLRSEWGSQLPYRRAAKVLDRLLPQAGRSTCHATVRRHMLSVGRRLDRRTTEPAEFGTPWPDHQVPDPARFLMVAIDGTYVCADRSEGMTQHHVITGRIERDFEMAGRFAWVGQGTADAVSFLREALRSHGMTSKTEVSILADGAGGLARIAQAASDSPPTSVLDWFHISMRLRPIEVMAPKVAEIVSQSRPDLASNIDPSIRGVRHQLWNGLSAQAFSQIRAALRAANVVGKTAELTDGQYVRRFRDHAKALHTYLRRGSSELQDYRRAHRQCIRISSAPAESGMAHLVNQRMGKRQSMRWKSESAHFLLLVRCAILDDRLEEIFRTWFPQFRATAKPA